MEYENIEEVKQAFLDGQFDFPDEFKVSGVTYRLRSSSQYSMQDMLKHQYKGVIVYVTSPSMLKQFGDKLNEIGLNHWILFLWGFDSNKIVPYDVRSTNAARGNVPIREEADGNFIGSTVEIRITNLPGSTMKGKVDTGADVSSLHSTQWKISNGMVHFKCPELSQNILIAPLADHQAVKSSDGGTEYRPVIELNVKINGKLLTNVLFNLNDRGQMQYPVLIGKNALTAGNFKIDPSLDESIEVDWEKIHELTKDDTIEK